MKSKRTIIISSCIMLLALVVAIVGVSAAWFGDVKSASTSSNLVIDSDTVSSTVSVEFSSDATNPDGIYPAIAKKGEFAHSAAPTGDDLYNLSSEQIEKSAQVAVFYFTITYIGAADSGATDGRKSLRLELLTAQRDNGTNAEGGHTFDEEIDYKDDFNVRMCLVKKVGEEYIPIDSAATPDDLTGGDTVYYKNDRSDTARGHVMDMRLLNEEYTVKFEVFFNKIDEECNHDLIMRTIRFTIKLSQIDRLTAGEVTP